MRKFRETAYWTAVLALGVGMTVGVAPASADSTDNDGVNIGNDNNVSVLPVQLCGNNVAVLGAVAPIGSPQNVECTNAPIVDHPEKPSAEEPPAEKPPAEEPPAEQPPAEKPPAETSPEVEPPADSSTDQEKPSGDSHTSTEVMDESEDLPEAPSPEVTEGHVAVTG